MPAFYLIGPSCVGKSTAGQFVHARISGSRFINLDAEMRAEREPGERLIQVVQDWSRVRAKFEELEALDSTLVIIDIGAGTQDLVRLGKMELVSWLTRPSVVTVLVTAAPREVWKRWIAGRPDMEELGYQEFLRMEFDGRAPLYSAATLTLDVSGIGSPRAGERLLGIARDVVGTDGAPTAAALC